MPEQMTKQDAIEYLLYMKHDVQAKSPMDIALDAAIEALKQPTIEPEVRHGSWETWGYVFRGIEWKRCSRCGKCADVSYYGLLEGQIRMSTPAICGVCGARMDATNKNVGGKGGADNG